MINSSCKLPGAGREFGVLEAVRDNYPKIVLFMNRYSGSGRNGIKWFNLIDFLLTPE